MSNALRPVSRPRLYEQLVDRLLDFIHAEKLGPGSRLPSERVLAQQLAVSRNTLKQAILVLEVQGIIEVRHGGGMYLMRDVAAAEPVEVMLERRARLPDILDAREAIETKLVELAARRRSEEDLAAIDAALDSMAEAVSSGGSAAPGDEAFHAALVAAAHSPVLAGLYGQLSPAIAESRLESLRQPGRPARSLGQHRKIARAVRDRDASAAVRAAREHVGTVRRVRLLDWAPGTGDQDEPH